MKLKKPKNSNYAATVVEITTLVPLENCDNVQAAIIFGNQVIVSKDTKIGDIGLFFPLECQLSKEYLSSNNLYRKSELNLNPDKKGYFEENGRIKAVRFRGHKSEGLFMPLQSLYELPIPYGKDYKIFDEIIVGNEFDELNGIEVCRKYTVKHSRTPGLGNNKKNKNLKKYESKLVDGQFKFHEDTTQLGKNLHKINHDSIVAITYKIHGTSGISSKILCKKRLTRYEKILKFLGVNIVDKAYDYIYSSRKVIKNEALNPNPNHFYNEDVWGAAHNKVKDFLQDGMTFYYEIAGYLSNGGLIQKDYDYGQKSNEFEVYIYRITYTNPEGKVYEFSTLQIQDFCKRNGLKAVPLLYYGEASEFSDERLGRNKWLSKFHETIKSIYNDKECYMCSTKVPEEGVVIRIEGLEFEAYKQKSYSFLERETKLLDKGESDIESEN